MEKFIAQKIMNMPNKKDKEKEIEFKKRREREGGRRVMRRKEGGEREERGETENKTNKKRDSGGRK